MLIAFRSNVAKGVAKSSCKDAGRQRYYSDTRQSRKPGSNPAHYRNRHNITVTYSREGSDGPPDCAGYRTELIRLYMPFRNVERAS